MRESRSQKVEGCRARHGFTLLELLIVVSIIAILISILMPATQALRQRAKEKQRDATQMALAHAIRAFRAEYGYWPTSDAFPAAGTLAPSQDTIIKNYLLSNGSKNKRKCIFWDVDAIVTNVVTKQPFSISINLTNDTVTVQ
jgi:prepilin-type N-terminal cleavage/methylation domain-containing protein